MEFTGKTVEEAIALGLSETGLTEETAEITVLDEGGKGFLKKTKARVDVSKKRTNGERAVKFLEELLDRMEIIELSSYTPEEKFEIAKRHLLPKQLKENGIRRGQLRLDDEALRAIITDYTKESGVRTLERQLGKLCRRAAMRLVETGVKRIDVTVNSLREFLDTPPYAEDTRSKMDQIGVVNGLAWTEVGGELLEVEAGVMDGTGKLELTGNLGQVMQESVKAAYTCLRSRAAELGIAPDRIWIEDKATSTWENLHLSLLFVIRNGS